MTLESIVPDLKRVVGALVFGADRPLSESDLRKCLREVAESEGGEATSLAEARPRDIRAAIDELSRDLQRCGCGFHIVEVAGGFRLQSDADCGKWLKELLKTGKPYRLSRPALETLAIIAYRQPVTKSEIEAVRGVNVDHMVKMLMEIQLVRISGRSDLPGRPFLYGTTHLFLEHFGLNTLSDLSQMEPMLARAALQQPSGGAGADEEVADATQESEEGDKVETE